MSFRTLMQAGPAKANELSAKLAETSDGAVKTREKLFTELKSELELHTSLEEQHLFPILKRNAETKELVADAVDRGARVLVGGERPDGPGHFYPPTVVVDVPEDARMLGAEIFGPVAAIMPFEHEDELVALANDTEYGLAAGVWTQNLARAHRLARRLDAGTIWVNTYRAMSPMSPRQGFKSSGVGIEHGIESMQEYTRLKSVWINTDEGPVADPFVMRS